SFPSPLLHFSTSPLLHFSTSPKLHPGKAPDADFCFDLIVDHAVLIFGYGLGNELKLNLENSKLALRLNMPPQYVELPER
ncbi:MAG TPA: hypothetical protein VI583_08710, partial [Cyclobacteriaceae bacterium]|nr:hypothetical protein [Cyclobacteriaceae bacterium]